MTLKQLHHSKIPIIAFDKKLEKLKGRVLFPEKLSKANEILSKTRIPKLK